MFVIPLWAPIAARDAEKGRAVTIVVIERGGSCTQTYTKSLWLPKSKVPTDFLAAYQSFDESDKFVIAFPLKEVTKFIHRI